MYQHNARNLLLAKLFNVRQVNTQEGTKNQLFMTSFKVHWGELWRLTHKKIAILVHGINAEYFIGFLAERMLPFF